MFAVLFASLPLMACGLESICYRHLLESLRSQLSWFVPVFVLAVAHILMAIAAWNFVALSRRFQIVLIIATACFGLWFLATFALLMRSWLAADPANLLVAHGAKAVLSAMLAFMYAYAVYRLVLVANFSSSGRE